MNSGIYYILNQVNNKIYTGRTTNFNRRWAEHIYNSKRSDFKEYHYPLYRAFRKYGLDSFTFGIIEITNKENLYDRERVWYNILKPEYNQTDPEDVYLYNNKHVLQIDMSNLNIIKEFNSVVEAAEEMGLTSRSIAQVCRRETQSSAGYYWCFKNNYNKFKPKAHGSAKKVIQYHLDTNEIVNVFESATKAGKEMGVSKNAIINACVGKAKTSRGYRWCYEGI